MLGKDHKRLAEDIAKILKLNYKEKSALIKGSIDPDKERGRGEAHHYRKKYKIFDEVILSKKFFNKGDRISACYHLGKALHFIADTSITAGGKHDYIEENMGKKKFFIPKLKVFSLKEIYNLIDSIKQEEDLPKIATNIGEVAYLVSYNVFRKNEFDDKEGFYKAKKFFFLRIFSFVFILLSFLFKDILKVIFISVGLLGIFIFSTSPSYTDYKIWYNI